ncbi:MAG: hypothetical protein ACJASQ_003083 [Crocinitomicaceae bacterium]|jgi:hypothetical protein
MKSKRHFEKIKELFAVVNKEELIYKIQELSKVDDGRINNVDYRSVRSIGAEFNIDEIGTIS